MKNLIIIGGGFAGSYAAKHLETTFNTTLIDTKDYFEFTPSVLRTIVEPSHASKIEIKHQDYLKTATIIHAEVTELTATSVKFNNQELPFDYCIIATGSHYATPIKDENIVLTTRAREFKTYANKVEQADQVLIIGGGIVGVELAAEIICTHPQKKVTIIHGGSTLCERLPPTCSTYITTFLTKRGVKIIYNERIEYAKNSTFISSTKKEYQASVVFWCTGIKPSSELLTKNFNKLLAKNNSININNYLQLENYPHIFAAGDITSIIEEKLAQTAENHAKIVVENIKRQEQNKTLKTYTTTPKMMVISLGKHHGVITYKNKTITGLIPGIFKNIIEKVEMLKMRL